MGRVRKNPAGRRSGDAAGWHGGRGIDDNRWGRMNREDDPLHDLRPRDEDLADPAADEFMWPDLSDDNEDDD